MDAEVVAKLRRCAAMLEREATGEQPPSRQGLMAATAVLRDLATGLEDEDEAHQGLPEAGA